MKYLGRMDLAGNDLLNLVLGRKTSGSIARTGEIDLVDNQLRVCVILDDGLPVWLPDRSILPRYFIALVSCLEAKQKRECNRTPFWLSYPYINRQRRPSYQRR
jgi:hypothetical protein